MAESMNDILDQGIAALEEETTVIDALDVLVDTQIKQLRALQVDPVKVEKFKALQATNRAKLAAAFEENLVVPPVDPGVHPEGSVDNGDGTFTYPDGTIHNADGTVAE